MSSSQKLQSRPLSSGSFSEPFPSCQSFYQCLIFQKSVARMARQENGARESHGCEGSGGGRGSHEPLEFISTFCNDVKKCQELVVGCQVSASCGRRPCPLGRSSCRACVGTCQLSRRTPLPPVNHYISPTLEVH